VLANAAEFRDVPGRKTDVNDAIPACAGAGLYGALAVKRRSVVAVTTWWIDCRQFLEVEFDDVCSLSAGAELSRFGADYPAKHGIPLAGGPRWRLRRPSVSALEQGWVGAAGEMGGCWRSLARRRACRCAELIGVAPMRGPDLSNSYC
jgi:hypothetical protein